MINRVLTEKKYNKHLYRIQLADRLQRQLAKNRQKEKTFVLAVSYFSLWGDYYKRQHGQREGTNRRTHTCLIISVCLSSCDLTISKLTRPLSQTRSISSADSHFSYHNFSPLLQDTGELCHYWSQFTSPCVSCILLLLTVLLIKNI